jgi:TRAP-type mannitol/chloroaromatic compound transport system substrate-binding protein
MAKHREPFIRAFVAAHTPHSHTIAVRLPFGCSVHSKKTSRRNFLLAGAAAGTLAAPTVHAQSPMVRWRLTTAFPKTLELMSGASESLARYVTQMSGGRFHISVHAPGELAQMPQIVDAVKDGTVECGHTYPAYYFGKDETFALDGAVPFGLNARQMSAWSTEGNGAKLMRDFYRTYNIVNFPLGNTGAQMGGWYRKEIRSVADLSGLKLRMGGFASRVAMRIGIAPQNVKEAEIYTALEKGTIDGADWYTPFDDLKAQFFRVAPFYYYPGWWEGSAQLSLYCNSKAYDALPADYKLILETAAARVHAEMLTRYDIKNPQALRTLLSSGTRLYRFPQEILSAAFKASNEHYAELSASNPNWKRVFEDWSKYRSDQNAWFRVAEGSFDQFMQAQRL